MVSVVFKSAHQNNLAEATDAARSVVKSSAVFPDSPSDVLIVEAEIVEED